MHGKESTISFYSLVFQKFLRTPYTDWMLFSSGYPKKSLGIPGWFFTIGKLLYDRIINLAAVWDQIM